MNNSRPAVKKERHTELKFRWQSTTVQARYNDEQATLNLSERVMDPLSLYLLVMRDLQRGHQAAEYTLVNRTRLRTYTVQHHGPEILKTPMGNLKTLKISRQRSGSRRKTILWFAQDLGYLPAQITQTRKGKEHLRLVIRKLQR